ncbi:hypothetical protein PsorP6_006271 [Peronosclerospora sorghi]|uniref:Uncharacterized protein n=1 Tax=Peronosclerospora sorghi TaxID=230839 RepID=A0ACC0W3R5_9STRA|nr:hypothetical protein PsorP6_006271 [Peronosclerospora sorghi]
MQSSNAEDSATSKWMKMISSTFLGEGSSSPFFARHAGGSTCDEGARVSQESLQRWAKLRAENGLNPTPELKIALVGGSAVGKTSIVRRWLQRSYPPTYCPTIGVDIHTLMWTYCNQDVLLHIWDVSSAEVDASASSIHSLVCDELDGVFFVFNVHRVSSIAAIDKWRHCLSKYVSPKETPCFLLAHKADLLQKRVMTSADIAAYAKTAGYKGWMWTVGKAALGESDKKPAVKDALDRMVEWICRDRFATEHLRLARLTKRQGVLETSGTPARLPIVPVDDTLRHFPSSLRRLPMKTITTLPREDKRDDDGMKFDGGSWMVGLEKGVYLHPTSCRLLGNDTTDDEVDSVEEFVFPFGNTRDFHAQENASESCEDDEQEEKREDEEDEAWRFFAGSISRTQAETLLATREPGTFLLRRKDAQTLILSYLGSDHVHHVLIEYTHQRYHVGSSKTPGSTSFATLWKCLRSVRRYAYRGLVFTRDLDFNVVKKQNVVLQESSSPSGSVIDTRTPRLPSRWCPRSGSTSSPGSSSHSRQASPTPARKARGLQATQEQVTIPPQVCLNEIIAEYYDNLRERIAYFANHQEPEEDCQDVTRLLKMVEQEKKDLWPVDSHETERKWRELVKNMETWNRIVMNLELCTVKGT